MIFKLKAAFFGILTIFLAFFCHYAGTTVLQISLSIFGLLGGPLLGVISLGIFCKSANSTGALTGLIISTLVNVWLGVGSVFYGKRPALKPMRIDGCVIVSNLTLPIFFTNKEENSGFEYLYFNCFQIYKLYYKRIKKKVSLLYIACLICGIQLYQWLLYFLLDM